MSFKIFTSDGNQFCQQHPGADGKNDGPEGQCLIEIGEINQEAGVGNIVLLDVTPLTLVFLL